MLIVDAERIIKQGGVYVNQRRVTQPQFVLIPGEHILPHNITVIRVGKYSSQGNTFCTTTSLSSGSVSTHSRGIHSAHNNPIFKICGLAIRSDGSIP